MSEKVRLSSPALRYSPTAQQDHPHGVAGRPSLWRPVSPLTGEFEVPSGRLCPMWMGGALAQLPHPTRQSAKAALQLTALGSCPLPATCTCPKMATVVRIGRPGRGARPCWPLAAGPGPTNLRHGDNTESAAQRST